MAILDATVRERALDAARVLAGDAVVRAAYVFGSHAEGRADPFSDIDVALFVDGLETWDLHRRVRAMARVQKEAGLEVEAHLFPASAIEHRDAASFAAWILDHGVEVRLQ